MRLRNLAYYDDGIILKSARANAVLLEMLLEIMLPGNYIIED